MARLTHRSHIAQDSSLLHFTNRREELDRLRQLLQAPGDLRRPLPVLAFQGEGGIGKTWLLERFREVARAEYSLPTAYIRFDRDLGGGPFLDDYVLSLYDLRKQIGVEAPRFDLADAVYRFKQDYAGRPELSGEGALSTVFEFVVKAAEGMRAAVSHWVHAPRLDG